METVILETFKQRVRSTPKRTVFAEGDDRRVIDAGVRMRADGLVREAIPPGPAASKTRACNLSVLENVILPSGMKSPAVRGRLTKPYNDISRATRIEDIINLSIITQLQE